MIYLIFLKNDFFFICKTKKYKYKYLILKNNNNNIYNYLNKLQKKI